MKDLEYRQASAAHGGLLFMQGVPDVAYGDQVIVTDHRNHQRNGQVVQSSIDLITIQVIEGTDDLDLERTWVRFLQKPFEISLSIDILGRIFDGLGNPRDQRPPIVSSLKRNVNGAAVNPAARAYPKEFIQTGISSIDGLNSLVRGQKLPIFPVQVYPIIVYWHKLYARQNYWERNPTLPSFLPPWEYPIPMPCFSRKTLSPTVYLAMLSCLLIRQMIRH